MMTSSRLPLSDIDTQIESLLDKWLDDAMSTSYIGVGIDGYKGETDTDKIEELRTADFEKYRSDTTKAIKTLLIQSKITELGYIQTEYGDRFLATTFADGDGQTIEARIADLKEELPHD